VTIVAAIQGSGCHEWSGISKSLTRSHGLSSRILYAGVKGLYRRDIGTITLCTCIHMAFEYWDVGQYGYIPEDSVAFTPISWLLAENLMMALKGLVKFQVHQTVLPISRETMMAKYHWHERSRLFIYQRLTSICWYGKTICLLERVSDDDERNPRGKEETKIRVT
jgi:hypothetical protein